MKNNVFLLTISLLLSQCLFSQDSSQIKVDEKKQMKLVIPEATIIRVKSLTALSSKTVNEGDIIDFAVYEDLEIEGKIVIKEGTVVKAFVESSEKAKGLGKEGNLKIQFTFTKAVDGTKIPLRSTKGTIEGESKTGGAVALAVVVSPLFLLKKGKEAKIAEGKIMEAYISRDITLLLTE